MTKLGYSLKGLLFCVSGQKTTSTKIAFEFYSQ